MNFEANQTRLGTLEGGLQTPTALQGHFDQLVVAAPPAMLERLQRAYPEELRCKIGAEHPRYMTHLSARELRQELSCL